MPGSPVFAKTELGAGALHAAREAMPAPARRLLILVDGQRDLEELSTMLGTETVQLWLPKLAQDGYVRAVQRAAPSTLRQPLPPSEPAVPTAQGAGADAAPPRGVSLAGLAARAALVCAAVAAIWWWYSGTAPEQGGLGTADRTSDTARNPPAPDAQPGVPPTNQVPAPSLAPSGASAPPAAPPPGSAAAALPARDRAARALNERPLEARRAGAADASSAAPSGAPRGMPDGAPSTTPAVAARSPPAGAPEAGRGAPAAVNGTAVAQPAAVPVAPPAPLPRATLPEPPPKVAVVEPQLNAAAAPDAAPAAAAVPAGGAGAAAPTGEPPTRLRVRERALPVIPRRAIRAGIDRGRVVVRLHVNAAGSVERVELVRADPPQIYDVSVQRVFEGWTFDPPGKPAVQVFEIEFKP